MQKPIMEWNTQKKIWQHLTDNHLFELWEPFLGTWPTSGMTVNGQVFELPMRERLTTDLESSSLPTPTVSDQYTANLTSTQQKEGSLHSVTLAQVFHREDLFPTPTVFHVSMHDEPIDTFLAREEKSSTGQIGKSLGVALRMEMMPTPTTQDGKNNGGPSQFERNTLPLNAEVLMLPTPQVDDSKNTGHNQTRRPTLASEVWETERTTSWGKFEPAIRRWEEVLGRPAPEPTKPDGKEGNHRLSSAFTEWMMGVPEGWITGAGISRNEELKAAGNGVVPQQAELALRILLAQTDFISDIE